MSEEIESMDFTEKEQQACKVEEIVGRNDSVLIGEENQTSANITQSDSEQHKHTS